MKPKFLLDVGVGHAELRSLFALGVDCVPMSNIEPDATDEKILEIANSENRILVTMYKDFGELVYSKKLSHHGVLLLRPEDANGLEKAKVVRELINKYENLLPGSFSVYKNGNLRVRNLFSSAPPT